LQNFLKSKDFYKALRNDINVDNTLTAVDAASHSRQKKLLGYGFTDKAMNSAEKFIVQHVDRWCELLIAVGKGLKRVSVLAQRLRKHYD